MTQEGKLSRALAKAGEGGALKPSDSADASPALAATAPFTRAASPPSPRLKDVRRVKGRAGDPIYSVVMVSDRLGEVASQIRALRAKILAMNDGNPPRIITVTSGTRAEGKSTVAINLAAALSEIESGRVLLIDADILRPNQHIIANVEAHTGLNDILADDQIPLDGNIYETAIRNLDLIPSRTMTDNKDAENVLHQHCGALLEKVRRHYAFVIIDTPPVMIGSQASTFGKKSDGVILVARLEQTPRHVVKRATEEMLASGASVIGCILTHHQHHVPNFIYSFFGTPPPRYYRYHQDQPEVAAKGGKTRREADAERVE